MFRSQTEVYIFSSIISFFFFLEAVALILYLRFQTHVVCIYFLAVLFSEKHREKLSWLWWWGKLIREK